MPKCPREDCDLDLIESEFAAPGAWECSEHGGPIWFQEEIELRTWEADAEPPEIQYFVNKFASLKLRYSVDRDMKGRLPTVVTIENMPPDSIDVQFMFDPLTGEWLGVKSRVDKGPTF